MVDKFSDKLYIFDIAKTAANKDKIVYKDFTKKEFDEVFNATLDKLAEDYKDLLKRTFIKNDKIWWCEYYPSSTYYKRREKALSSFFNLFEAMECLR